MVLESPSISKLITWFVSEMLNWRIISSCSVEECELHSPALFANENLANNPKPHIMYLPARPFEVYIIGIPTRNLQWILEETARHSIPICIFNFSSQSTAPLCRPALHTDLQSQLFDWDWSQTEHKIWDIINFKLLSLRNSWIIVACRHSIKRTTSLRAVGYVETDKIKSQNECYQITNDHFRKYVFQRLFTLSQTQMKHVFKLCHLWFTPGTYRITFEPSSIKFIMRKISHTNWELLSIKFIPFSDCLRGCVSTRVSDRRISIWPSSSAIKTATSLHRHARKNALFVSTKCAISSFLMSPQLFTPATCPCQSLLRRQKYTYP